MTETEAARELLQAAGVFFEDEPHRQTINLNDTWAWACADGEEVPDECLPEVAELFRRYGLCGVLYWVSERRGGQWTQFPDNNRAIEFVWHEEALVRESLSASAPGRMKVVYTIGAEPK